MQRQLFWLKENNTKSSHQKTLVIHRVSAEHLFAMVDEIDTLIRQRFQLQHQKREIIGKFKDMIKNMEPEDAVDLLREHDFKLSLNNLEQKLLIEFINQIVVVKST